MSIYYSTSFFLLNPINREESISSLIGRSAVECGRVLCLCAYVCESRFLMASKRYVVVVVIMMVVVAMVSFCLVGAGSRAELS